jgi:hypothetical protein
MLGKRTGPSDLTIVALAVGISVIVIRALNVLTADIALQVAGLLVNVNDALEIVAPLAVAVVTVLVRAGHVSRTAGVVTFLVMVSIHVVRALYPATAYIAVAIPISIESAVNAFIPAAFRAYVAAISFAIGCDLTTNIAFVIAIVFGIGAFRNYAFANITNMIEIFIFADGYQNDLVICAVFPEKAVLRRRLRTVEDNEITPKLTIYTSPLVFVAFIIDHYVFIKGIKSNIFDADGNLNR